VINSPALYSSLKIGQNAITHRPNYFRRFSQSLYKNLKVLILGVQLKSGPLTKP
jgi:hypothetical protein